MPKFLNGNDIDNEKNRGHIIFEKNNKKYKVKEEKILKRGRIGLYKLTKIKKGKSSALFELTIEENVSKVTFENCSLLFPTNSEIIKLEIWNRTAESELEFKNVYFDSKKEADITIQIESPYSNVVIQNINFERAQNEHTLNVNAMNTNICDIENISPILVLNAASSRKVVLEDIDIETFKPIAIRTNKLEYHCINLSSPYIRVYSTTDNGQVLIDSGDIIKGDIYMLDDEKLKKLEAISKLQSCLKTIKEEVDEVINDRVIKEINAYDDENKDKLESLNKQISDIANARVKLYEEVEIEEQIKPIEKIYKKNTK